MEIDPTSRGVIVAPAGHGKTHLVATRIARAAPEERLLVLTHTNVAVRALRKRLTSKPRAAVRIETLDALALRIATAFPTASGVPQEITGGNADWEGVVRPGAVQALQSPAILRAFTQSYTSAIVDEFQDCTNTQNALIRVISERIPTVVLGDPMQSVYQFKSSEFLDWSTRVEGHRVLGSLDIPWRWQANTGLGRWILMSRNHLSQGQPITIGGTTAASVFDLEKPIQQAGLSSLLRKLSGTTAVISGDSANTSRLRDIARGNRWSNCEVFETAAPKELAALAEAHETGTTAGQALALITFTKACMSKTGKVSGAATCEKNLKQSGTVGRSKSVVAGTLRQFLSAPSGVAAQSVLAAYEADEVTYTYRPNLLRLAYRIYKHVGENDCGDFQESLREVLEARKHVDEAANGPVVGTPLRLKGLEFDNAVIVDSHDFETAEQLYVAISRASNQIIFAIEEGQHPGRHITRA